MLCGAFQRTGFEECGDSLPLFWRDAENECVIQSVDEIDRVVECCVARNEGRQILEFERAARLDAVEGGTRELKRFAVELIDGRANAIGNLAETDADAEREWLDHHATS